jgi:16S rRNA (adenine(1408)-N(1))-methyltransferase
VVIDIGTGDGFFVCRSAQANPNKFFIGIDANRRPLEKVSEKIYRKPARGGLSNVLFIQAAVEDLPHELDGVADEVHIQFPWGSLLQAVAMGNENALRNIRRICAPECVLSIIVGLDPERDQSEIKRLGLKSPCTDFLDRELELRYQASGFEIQDSRVLDQSEWPRLQSTWAKRLRGNQARILVNIIARAAKLTT